MNRKPDETIVDNDKYKAFATDVSKDDFKKVAIEAWSACVNSNLRAVTILGILVTVAEGLCEVDPEHKEQYMSFSYSMMRNISAAATQNLDLDKASKPMTSELNERMEDGDVKAD